MIKKWLLSLAVVGVVFGVGGYFHDRATPQYAWLAFGPEGKLRIQVTLEGEALTLEQFLDGKPTGQKNHFKYDSSQCANITIVDPDGKTSYNITRVSDIAAKADEPRQLLVSVDIKGPLEYSQYCDVAMKEDLENARLAHFHGPLTAGPVTIYWKVPPKLALRRGDKPTDLPAFVGTFDADKGCWVVVRSEVLYYRPEDRGSAFPQDVYPFVDVEFPAKQAGAPTIKKRYPLDQFC